MSEETTLPEYLTDNGDGTVDIALKGKLEIDGAKVTSLRMREPTVNDQLVAKATKGSDEIKELTGLANLCGITLDDIKRLTMRDLKRVQDGYLVFTD